MALIIGWPGSGSSHHRRRTALANTDVRGLVVRHPVDIGDRIVAAAVGLAGGDRRRATATLVVFPSPVPATLFWSSLLQPASAAVRNNREQQGSAVIAPPPCALAEATVKGVRLHVIETGHSFVDAMPHQAGTSAQRIRIGQAGLAFAFLLVLLGSIISRSSQDDTANSVQPGRFE